jgi:hypothetical protein
MIQRRIKIAVLCEDRQQEVFARHFLKKRGFRGNFTFFTCPDGSQSGEQYVRLRYPGEVIEYRRQANFLSIGLVVVIDADKKTVTERINQLDLALRDAGQEPRKPNEKIAIFVPKRNIETWIHYLQNENVDEESEYTKFTNNEASCKPFVEDLANKCKQGVLDENAPPSLQVACGELQRILPLLDKL